MSSSRVMNDFLSTNSHLKSLPSHLLQYIVDQDYEAYSPVNHSVWRYVMKQNLNYLPKVIFGDYLNGLNEAGITIDKIPNLYGMNRILQKVGWAAVCVDGFIPPKAFMEFQAHRVLVIAADIRQINHIEYTPAPDILHEAAGHAPIIPNETYSEYLQFFGEIGSKAFSSSTDLELFESIRNLSILKEAPGISKKLINKSQKEVESIQEKAKKEDLSEMSMIRNLHWWTVEYGLIGTLKDPKIYGAGLLSSIGESVWCMSKEVKKIKYNINACKVNFDITKPQPQLFVTPSFEYLIDVLNQFSNNMAYKKGGEYSIEQAISSKQISTCIYNNGLQISGIFTALIKKKNIGIYIKTLGPTSLSYKNKEIKNHGPNFHKDGFGAPLGKIINYELSNLNLDKCKSSGLFKGSKISFKYETGLQLDGVICDFVLNDKDEVLLISFVNCNVKYYDEYLFKDEWGQFDLVVSEKIISSFPGPADKSSFTEKKYDYKSQTIKINYSSKDEEIHSLYKKVEEIRIKKSKLNDLEQIFRVLKFQESEEWLLLLEICEISKLNDLTIYPEVKEYLSILSKNRTDLHKLIKDGLKLL